MMKLATTLENQRKWVRQWRETAVFLDEMRRYELAHLTPEEARRDAECVLSIPGGWRNPNAVCGLIEQQAVFQRYRTK
jgi:hypothetical protein